MVSNLRLDIYVISVYLAHHPSSLDQLAQYTESTNAKVHELATKGKEVAKGCTAQPSSAQIQAKLLEMEDISDKFNQIAEEQLLHCTG